MSTLRIFFQRRVTRPEISRDDIFTVNEGHFEIELGEFGLAVGTEVFIAEAAGDLHVAFEAADHQDLFEKLRGLGEGVEGAGVHAGGDEEFACALRGWTL